MRRAYWQVIALALFFIPSVNAQVSPKCGAATDLMVQALESVSSDSSIETIREAGELLKRSVQMCSELGDSWYYRSLFEARLNHPPLAKFALSQAVKLGSRAMNEQLNPFVLATPKNTPPAPLNNGSRWALVVGVNEFADSNIDPLLYTADDAKLFAATLESKVAAFPGDHIKLLTGEEATTAAIRSGLNWIARSAKPEDIVVIYVATHGSARSSDSVAGANYLITHDTMLGPNNDQDLLFGTALPMYDLVSTVANRIGALRVAIFIDTCYSGGIRYGRHGNSISDQDLRKFDQGQGRIIMAAARPDQQSLESKALGHGYFTYFLVQALRLPSASPLLSQVYQVVEKSVSEKVQSDLKIVHQNPVLSRSSDSTDFALTQGTK